MLAAKAAADLAGELAASAQPKGRSEAAVADAAAEIRRQREVNYLRRVDHVRMGFASAG